MQIPDSSTVAAYIQAKNYTPVTKREVLWLVIHDMESAEGSKTARNVASWFAGSPNQEAPRTSIHYCVDAAEIVQCVREADVAWHAPGANSRSIGVEHAGRASQTAVEWLDPYSAAMLKLSAHLFADICKRHKIPVQYVDAAGLLKGTAGITTHAQVTKAWKKSTHTDPGPNFPMTTFLAMVRKS